MTIHLSKRKFTFAQTLRLNHLQLASAREVDSLAMHEELKGIFRTGTLVAYPAPGKALPNEIVSDGLYFTVPSECVGLVDTAIIVTGYSLDFDGTIIPNKNGFSIMTDFPKESGYYSMGKNGITDGHPSSSTDGNARYLWRSNGAYVGAVIRSGIHAIINPFVIGIASEHSVALPVAYKPHAIASQ